MIFKSIKKLVTYGLEKGLIKKGRRNFHHKSVNSRT